MAGTFNDWRPEVTPMVLLGDGRWRKELTLPPGVYEYQIVVDGEWMPDPLAPETTPNRFGGMNSVLRIEIVGQIEAPEEHNSNGGAHKLPGEQTP
jgi:hypothetical protein